MGVELGASLDLLECLPTSRCCLLQSPLKRGALLELARLMEASGAVPSAEDLARMIFRREASMSTGIGLGIAVPHARMEGVTEPAVALGVSPAGLRGYESIDEEPVRLVAMIVTAAGRPEQYSRLLGGIVATLKVREVREDLTMATEPAEIRQTIAASLEDASDGDDV